MFLITEQRPSWNEYFMNIAEVVSQRSTCLRRQVGALIVADKRILATGYNGAPTGMEHCEKFGCIRIQKEVPSGERHELCRGLHAEQNAIIQAALYGVGIRDGIIYCTHHPCIVCAKMLVNAGIQKIVIRDDYPDELAKNVFREAGIGIEILER